MSDSLAMALEHLAAQLPIAELLDAERPFERLVLAVMGRTKNPRSGVTALAQLREAGIRDARTLLDADPDELVDLLRGTGDAARTAGRLRRLARLAIEQCDGDFAALVALPAADLREALAALPNFGRATVDRILLEAADIPTPVVDLAAHRVLKRHGWVEMEADHDLVAACLAASVEPTVEALRRTHALLDEIGRDYCRPRAHCQRCPLREWLPASGPIEPYD